MTYSVRDVVGRVITRLRIYGILLATLLTATLAFIQGHQTNSALCAFLKSKLDAVRGPLGRELVLNEITTAQAILGEIQDQLWATGFTGELTLTKGNPWNLVHPDFECNPRFFSTNVLYPITFSDSVLGVITGKSHYLPGISFWILLSAIILGIGLVFRQAIKVVNSEIEREVIHPVYALSTDETLPSTYQLPREVAEVKANIEKLKLELIRQERSAAEVRKLAQIGEMAAQVAHDVRSPLVSLNLMLRNMPELSDKARISINRVITMIQSTANSLMNYQRGYQANQPDDCSGNQSLLNIWGASDSLNNELLALSIEEIVCQKQLQLEDKPAIVLRSVIDAPSYFLFARVNSLELKRLLSNLVDNACEALEGAGEVEINLTKVENQTRIIVKDSGKGIPGEILPLLTRRGGTYGKYGGSGLGLYHARQMVEAWGGTLKIRSELGAGTEVIIEVPSSQPPRWHIEELKFRPGDKVVVLDDDEISREMWGEKLRPLIDEYQPGIELFLFKHGEELLEWYRNNLGYERTLFLMDFELHNAQQNGLDLINMLGVAKDAVLVSNRADEFELQKRCEKFCVRVLPKALILHLPILMEAGNCPSGISCDS